MKKRTKELDVDFIGGQSNPLTKEEEISISAFIRQLKAKRTRAAGSRIKKTGKQPA